MKRYGIYNKSKKRMLAEEVIMADHFCLRLKGLLGRNQLKKEEGLLLYPCSGIHCFGMKFPIDAVFLDRSMKVIHIEDNMKPGAKAKKKGARYVLELMAGAVEEKGIAIEDLLEIVNEKNYC